MKTEDFLDSQNGSCAKTTYRSFETICKKITNNKKEVIEKFIGIFYNAFRMKQEEKYF